MSLRKGTILILDDRAQAVGREEVDKLLRAETGKEAVEKVAALTVLLDEHLTAKLGVRHVAPTAAGDEEFPPELGVLFEEQDASSALGGTAGSHHASGSAPDDTDIRFEVHGPE